MFECTTTLTIQNGRLDESIAILRESVVPILRDLPGLLSLALIPHPEQSRLSLVSIWKSKAHAQAAEANPDYHQAVKRLDPLIVKKADDASTEFWKPNFKARDQSLN